MSAAGTKSWLTRSGRKHDGAQPGILDADTFARGAETLGRGM